MRKRFIILAALVLSVSFGALGVGIWNETPAVSASSDMSLASRRLSDYPNHIPVGASIATTSTTDTYYQVGRSGTVLSIKFSSLAALAADDTNYVTWTVTNLGQAGAGSTALLAATNANTTKATGGTAIVASSSRPLTLSATSANLVVTEGDVLRFRATATGTLAGAVTVPSYSIIIRANGQ